MKTLLILTLLFCFVEVNGQSDILTLANEYKSYCDNDSTRQIVGRGNVICLPMNPPIYKWDYYDTIYIHRYPSFDNFINWLNKKQLPQNKDLITYNNNLFEQNMKLNSELEKTKKDRNFWRCAFEMVVLVVGAGLFVKR